MSRYAVWIAGAGVACLIAYALYPLYDRQQLITDKTDTPAELTTAAGVAALANQLTPTATRFPSATPTRKPVVPTDTPHPTYVGQASPPPGYYVVPAITDTPIVPRTIEAKPPIPCVTVTPRPFVNQPCEMK